MRTTLRAKEGYIYTNGEVFAKIIDLAEGGSPLNWHEITEEEYQEILKKQEEEMLKEAMQYAKI